MTRFNVSGIYDRIFDRINHQRQMNGYFWVLFVNMINRFRIKPDFFYIRQYIRLNDLKITHSFASPNFETAKISPFSDSNLATKSPNNVESSLIADMLICNAQTGCCIAHRVGAPVDRDTESRGVETSNMASLPTTLV